jgi:hypothetical protein
MAAVLLIGGVLSGCDYSFAVPLEVVVSQELQDSWPGPWPLEVSAKVESSDGASTEERMGYFCGRAGTRVSFERVLKGIGCPRRARVTAWLAPLPSSAVAQCNVSGGKPLEHQDELPATRPEDSTHQQAISVRFSDCDAENRVSLIFER